MKPYETNLGTPRKQDLPTGTIPSPVVAVHELFRIVGFDSGFMWEVTVSCEFVFLLEFRSACPVFYPGSSSREFLAGLLSGLQVLDIFEWVLRKGL